MKMVTRSTQAPQTQFGSPPPVINAHELLRSVADVDAKKLMTNFLAIRSGIKLKTSAPKAQELAKNQGLTARAMFDHFSKRSAISTSDFPEIVSSLIERIETPAAVPVHRKIVKFIKAENFLPHEFLTSIDNMTVALVKENEPVPITTPKGLLSSITIETKRLRVPLTRLVVLQGSLNVAEMPTLMMAGAYRDEATATYAALESNPTLSDGVALFDASNTLTGVTLLADLGAAMKLFRNQKTSPTGTELAHLEPRFFVVPVDYEIDAYKAVFAAGMTGKIEVLATAAVSSSYLMADPEEMPVLIRLALEEMPHIETRQPPGNIDAVVVLDLFHDYKIAAVNRVGIVKLTP